MADNNEGKLNEEQKVELQDLPVEVSEEELKAVQGGDLHINTKPIVKKVTFRP